MALWSELKRRKVVQVAAVYAVTAWLIVQVIGEISEPLSLPDSFDTIVIVLLAVGFPIALILAWAFDITPDGVRATPSAVTGGRAAQPSAPAFTYVIQGLVLLAVGFLIVDQYLFEESVLGNGGDMETPTRSRVTRFSIPISSASAGVTAGTSDVAITQTGADIIYVLQDGAYVRPMGALELRRLAAAPGSITAMASSPDGGWFAYFDFGALAIRRLALTGGTPLGVATLDAEILGDDGRIFDMTWSVDGMLRFATATGIYAVSADGGGTPERIVEVADGSVAFRPQLLPDGDTLLFSIAPMGRWDDGEIVTQSLSTGARKSLVSGGTNAHFVGTGHIVYALGSRIYAVAFDADTLTTSGDAVEVADNVLRGSYPWLTGAALFDISADGTLVYMSGIQEPRRQLVWVDRRGREEVIPAEPRNYEGIRLSPDDSRLVVNEFNARNDIWIWDFTAQTMTRLLLGANGGDAPIWTPDGRRIAYHPSIGSFADVRAANNTGAPSRLFTAAGGPFGLLHPAEFVPPDGDRLLFIGQMSSASGSDIGLAKLDGSDEYEWLISGAFRETVPRLAPGARWLAFVSDETGRSEVYVTPFPNVDAGRWQVSNRGGDSPVWSPDGTALFYLEPGDPPRLIEVELPDDGGADDGVFRFGERVPLFEWPYWAIEFDSAFDVNRDGTRFIAIKLLEEESDELKIVVVENWLEELDRLVPPAHVGSR